MVVRRPQKGEAPLSVQYHQDGKTLVQSWSWHTHAFQSKLYLTSDLVDDSCGPPRARIAPLSKPREVWFLSNSIAFGKAPRRGEREDHF